MYELSWKRCKNKKHKQCIGHDSSYSDCETVFSHFTFCHWSLDWVVFWRNVKGIFCVVWEVRQDSDKLQIMYTDWFMVCHFFHQIFCNFLFRGCLRIVCSWRKGDRGRNWNNTNYSSLYFNWIFAPEKSGCVVYTTYIHRCAKTNTSRNDTRKFVQLDSCYRRDMNMGFLAWIKIPK